MRDNYWTRRAVTRRRLLGSGVTAGVGAAGLALVGCGDDDTTGKGGAATSPTAAGVPQTAGQAVDLNATVRVAIPDAKGGLDPMTPGNVTTLFSPGLHFDRLIQEDLETQGIVPLVATWELVDQQTAIFHLTKGVKWHDGTALTAEDVKFSLDRMRGIAAYNADGKYQTGGALYVAPIKDVIQVVDDVTVRVPLQVDVTAPFVLESVPLVPKKFIEANGDDSFNRTTMGSGPFKVLSYTPDTEVRSARFDDYFVPYEAKNRHKAWVKELRQLVKPEPLARVAALEAGEVDVVLRLAPELVKPFDGRSGFTAIYDPGQLEHHFYPNTRAPMLPDGSNPFRDIRVRMAMNHALDVETMIKKLGTGREQRSYGIGSQQLGHLTLDEAKPLTFGFDPQKAKALMAQAGYAQGFQVDFFGTKGFSSYTENVALTAQQQFADIGIKLNLILEPLSDFRARFAAQGKWAPGIYYYFGNQQTNPISVINAQIVQDGTQAVAYYPETGLQKKVEAQRIEFDATKRLQILKDMAKELYTNASWVFLFEEIETGVIRSNLEWDLKGRRRGPESFWAIRPLLKK